MDTAHATLAPGVAYIIYKTTRLVYGNNETSYSNRVLKFVLLYTGVHYIIVAIGFAVLTCKIENFKRIIIIVKLPVSG